MRIRKEGRSYDDVRRGNDSVRILNAFERKIKPILAGKQEYANEVASQSLYVKRTVFLLVFEPFHEDHFIRRGSSCSCDELHCRRRKGLRILIDDTLRLSTALVRMCRAFPFSYEALDHISNRMFDTCRSNRQANRANLIAVL